MDGKGWVDSGIHYGFIWWRRLWLFHWVYAHVSGHFTQFPRWISFGSDEEENYIFQSLTDCASHVWSPQPQAYTEQGEIVDNFWEKDIVMSRFGTALSDPRSIIATCQAIIILTTHKAEVDTGHAWPTYPLSILHQGAPHLWYLLLKILVNPSSDRRIYDTLMYWYTTRSTINKGTCTIVNIGIH